MSDDPGPRWFNNPMIVFVVGYVLAVAAVAVGFYLSRMVH
jgi:hypothetical protein